MTQLHETIHPLLVNKIIELIRAGIDPISAVEQYQSAPGDKMYCLGCPQAIEDMYKDYTPCALGGIVPKRLEICPRKRWDKGSIWHKMYREEKDDIQDSSNK